MHSEPHSTLAREHATDPHPELTRHHRPARRPERRTRPVGPNPPGPAVRAGRYRPTHRKRPRRACTPAGPRRASAHLAAATALAYGASALSATVALLYFTTIIRLPLGAVGAAMTAAGFAGLVVGAAAGRLCDAGRARTVLAGALATDAIAVAAFIGVGHVASCVIALCAYASATQAAYTARAALAAETDPEDPSGLGARLYKIGNIGYAAGCPLSAAALAVGSRTAYTIALAVAAAAYLAAGLIAARMRTGAPHQATTPRPAAARTWPDRRFLALTGLVAVVSIQFAIFEYGLPLWVTGSTSAPHWTVAGSVLLATLLVVALQPAASRRTTAPTRAAWAVAAAGCAAAVGAVLLAAAAGHRPAAAIALVAAAALLLAVAEVGQVVGALTLGYALTPPGAHGIHQGVYSLGPGLALSAGPLLLSATVLTRGMPAWLGLGTAVAAAGLAVPLLLARAVPHATAGGRPNRPHPPVVLPELEGSR